MSSILYYSNYCAPSQKLIKYFSGTKIREKIHFLSIDSRLKEKGKVYILLENGQKMLFPETVTKVPALLLLHQGNRIVYGDSIYKHFKPQEQVLNQQATNNNMEPLAFSIYEMGANLSDKYCYLDISPDDLKAKGNGGLRQMHSFTTLMGGCGISTPPEDYIPDKVGEVDMGKLQEQRNNEIQIPTQ